MWAQEGYYSVYGGATAQYPVYGAAAGIMTGNTAFYPYFQFGQGSGGAATATAATSGHGYSVPYPPVLHYSAVASTAGLAGLVQHFGGPLSIAPTPAHAASKSKLMLNSHDYGSHSSGAVISGHLPSPAHSRPLLRLDRARATLGLTMVPFYLNSLGPSLLVILPHHSLSCTQSSLQVQPHGG
ncbi:RNA recognition motif containing protein [Musa troglodytarum]|uniref:RNA recognition motif containing protein n=1 Tax=Musa troglodytarum TaxID=320322 RepID=A0A9E7JAJ7_9LILI|nr:RNA recognition motif containing protein [Musa troglodytarum]